MGLKSKMRELAYMVGLASFMAEAAPTLAEKRTDFRPKAKRVKRKIIPAGAKYFHFDAQGESTIGAFPLSDTVFSCMAINIKNSERKYNRWSMEQVFKNENNED